MGCTVEARWHASGSLVVRELRVWQDGALLTESFMTFAPGAAAG
jgi:hypothetical protein